MHSQPDAAGVFTTSRPLPFPPEQVFKAFARPERLAAWWGPDGFTNEFEIFEFRPGGRWKFVMQGPDGARYPNDSVFDDTSPRRIVVAHRSPPRFTLTVTLVDVPGPGARTRVEWHQAFDDPRVAEAVAHIVVPANEQNLDRLHRTLEALSA